MEERGVSMEEVERTISEGEQFSAKHGRTGFRRNFNIPIMWQGKQYANKQVEVFAVMEENRWVIVTVIARYF